MKMTPKDFLILLKSAAQPFKGFELRRQKTHEMEHDYEEIYEK
jgi:hypothetical protein